MKKPSRFLRMFGVAGLLIGLLAATMAPAIAQDDGVDDLDLDWLDAVIGGDAGFLAGNNTIYYPWVANDDDFGLGAADTSISVQNLEDRATVIHIYVGDGEGGFDLVTSAFLSPFAAKTFTTEMLGIASGDGAPVKVAAFTEGIPVSGVPGFPGLGPNVAAVAEMPIMLSNPIAAAPGGGQSTQVIACVTNYFTFAQPGLGEPLGYVAAVDHTFAGDGVAYAAGDWVPGPFTQQELQDTLNAANAGLEEGDELVNPFGGLNNDGDCFDVIIAVADGDGTFFDSVAIGGVALQTAEAGVPGNGDDNDAETMQISTASDTSVSGYNAINGVELDYFSEWYLPIVQTNCGPGGCWDSMLRIGNLDFQNNAVTVRFFPADDGSGSLQTGFQIQALVDGGDTWHISLSDYVPEGWVGSAHILSDGAVFAMVDRYKVGTNMWITNTGSSADFENVAQIEGANGRYALFAPHVLLDYFGWNTGINVANLVNADNHVSIQYFNLFGNATEVFSQRLAAHGMSYFYDPSVPAQGGGQDVTTDPNANIVGSAIIWSDAPVAAAVDATKYPETDPTGSADIGHATSYNATANVFPWQAVPYVTKGNPTDGSGATSGINIMNPHSTATTARVYWVNPSGVDASAGTSAVTIPGFANGFVYTLWQHNLPNGFMGAAQVVASQSVVAASANVNYDVDGDGAAIFNAFNPCGLYRVGDPCTFGDPFEPGGQSFTKYFVDENDEPVAGVSYSITQTSGGSYQNDGVSQADGSMTFTNLPAGTYDLEVNGVPDGYVLSEGVQETIVLREGVDEVVTNTLEWNQGFTKTVCVAGEFVFDDGEEGPPGVDFDVECSDTNLVGVSVVVYENIGETMLGGQVIGDVVFEGVTGADGTVGASLAPGDYVLCIYAEDGDVTTTNGEAVNVFLPQEATISALCAGTLLDFEWELFGDLFTVEPGNVTELENAVFVTNGVINIFAGVQGGTTTGSTTLDGHANELNGVGGVEVCLDGKCVVTNEDGTARIILEAEQFEGYWFPGPYSSGDYNLVCAEGGELNGFVTDQIACESQVAKHPGDWGPPPGGEPHFYYNATLDIAQDGYLDDNGVGTFDLVLEMEED